MLFRTALALEPSLRNRMEEVIAQPNLLVAHVEGGSGLVTSLRDESVDLVVAIEQTLPAPPHDTVRAVRALPGRPELVLMVSREDGAERAKLLAAGALAVLPTALADHQLRQTFRTLVKNRRTELLLTLQAPSDEDRATALDAATTASPRMAALLKTARRVARSDSSLLIQGETGTGKEWLARAIHAASDRREEPFVAVNCAALSESLLESELFGHERGAFTGAERARRGHFEMAHRGTLFLDEVGDMPPALQAKLLRAVEERKVQRLGSESPVSVDVRVMAATHRDLSAAVEQGGFRADLFYRLAVVELLLPALRHRCEDIPSLARGFIAHHRRRLAGSEVTSIAPAALEALCRHAWPGNVRELGNVLERAVLLGDSPAIGLDDLPRSVQGGGSGAPEAFARDLFAADLIAGRTKLVEAFEREYLAQVLAETRGRMDDAAARAGINVRTLREKLASLGLERRVFRRPRN